MMLDKSITRPLMLALVIFLAIPGASSYGAQQAPKTSKPTKPPAKKSVPVIDAVIEPKAIDILKAACSRLAAAKSMKFTAVISYEAPSRFGPSLVYTTKSDVTMQRPDKLKIVTPGDGPASEFYYNGKTIMAFAPKENLVATADAPATIDGALEFAFHSAEIFFPFSDLLVADPYAGLAAGMQLAFYMGQSNMVGGTTTDMVVYASDDVFVQIWIGAEDKLPRRMRAVYRRDPLQLRNEMELSNWQLDPVLAPEIFVSQSATAAKRIGFGHPSTMLPPGTKRAAFRKYSTTPPPTKTK